MDPNYFHYPHPSRQGFPVMYPYDYHMQWVHQPPPPPPSHPPPPPPPQVGKLVHINPAFYRQNVPLNQPLCSNPVTKRIIVNPKFFPGVQSSSDPAPVVQHQSVPAPTLVRQSPVRQVTYCTTDSPLRLVRIQADPPLKTSTPSNRQVKLRDPTIHNPHPATTVRFPVKLPSAKQSKTTSKYSWKKEEAQPDAEKSSKPALKPTKTLKTRYRLIKLHQARIGSPMVSSTPLKSTPTLRSRFKIDHRLKKKSTTKSPKACRVRLLPKLLQTKYKLIRKNRRSSLMGAGGTTPISRRPSLTSTPINRRPVLHPKLRSRFASVSTSFTNFSPKSTLVRSTVLQRRKVNAKAPKSGTSSNKKASKKKPKSGRYYQTSVDKSVDNNGVVSINDDDVDIGVKSQVPCRRPLGELPSFITL